MPELTRRSFLAGSTLAASNIALPAGAALPLSGKQGPGIYRYRLGDFQLTALYDGTWFFKIDDKFVRNVSGAAVRQAQAAAFLRPRVVPISFTALLVNTGSKLVLIDTGSAGQITDTAGYLLGNLAAAGIEPSAIDTVIISHFHPDHIDGLKTKDGDKVFTSAKILVPELEWKFWMDDANMGRAKDTVLRYFRNARRIFKDIASEVQPFKAGDEVVPGIVSVPAYGHTPGHCAFAIHSGNQSMLAMSDTAREPWLFVRHPEWQPSYDMDGPLAVKTRKAMLDRAAADRMLVEAFHFPFPACGHIEKFFTGYELVPAVWQPL